MVSATKHGDVCVLVCLSGAMCNKHSACMHEKKINAPDYIVVSNFLLQRDGLIDNRKGCFNFAHLRIKINSTEAQLTPGLALGQVAARVTEIPLCLALLQTCGPLWGQQCGSQYFYPGVCARLSPLFKPEPAFSPAVQSKTAFFFFLRITESVLSSFIASKRGKCPTFLSKVFNLI